MDQQTKRWYVLRAISGKEKKAKEYIESEVAKRGWQDLVSQVLIPTEKVFNIRNGKKIVKERPTMPGYVLIEADLLKTVSTQKVENGHTVIETKTEFRKDVVSAISDIPNVVSFLTERNGNPSPVRPDEINRILGTIDNQLEAVSGEDEVYIVGEPVKVIEGPFSTFAGIIEEVNMEKKKLTVTVKIFGRKTPLELGFNQVEKE
ncbi:MAG: transcription termination/antitermination factor NusG [Bacteroidales bacterium]|nr:transcription termination/antitermination factor NusG [Candidatus Colimorpha onthohippi]